MHVTTCNLLKGTTPQPSATYDGLVTAHVSEPIRAIPLHNRLEMLNNAVLNQFDEKKFICFVSYRDM
jgi:hypothetical protein